MTRAIKVTLHIYIHTLIRTESARSSIWPFQHCCYSLFPIQKYVAVGELGKATDTLDATGSIIQEKDFGIRFNENYQLLQLPFRSAALVVFIFFFVCRSRYQSQPWGEAESFYWRHYASSSTVSVAFSRLEQFLVVWTVVNQSPHFFIIGTKTFGHMKMLPS